MKAYKKNFLTVIITPDNRSKEQSQWIFYSALSPDYYQSK
jgi:hypothetical protein